MTDLCHKHKLVLGPDGQCVVCRRSASSFKFGPLAEEDEHLASRALTVLLGVCLLAALAALTYVWQLPKPSAGARYAPSGHTPAALQQQAIPASEGELVAASLSEQEPAPQASASGAQDVAAPKTAGPSSQDAPAVVAPVAAEPPPRKRPQLDRSGVEVTMYAAPWCYICDRARTFLRARGVTLIEHNVDADAQALARLAKLSPAGALPTFQVAGETLVGFDPAGLSQRIDDAVPNELAARRP